MLMKEKVHQQVLLALQKAGITATDLEIKKIQTDYPDPKLGDYSSNAALILAKNVKMSPKDLAKKIVEHISSEELEKIEIAGPGFINFWIKTELLLAHDKPQTTKEPGKILVEYFQPNIAKPMHMGLLRTTVIGDTIKRMLLYTGHEAESDTHMGDWGTQFGFLISAYKKHGDDSVIQKDPINELNKLYIKINSEAEGDESIREAAKQEFVLVEKGDAENRNIWKKFVDWSMQEFLQINELMDVLPFDHHWPESFYEDQMPAVVSMLKDKGLLVRSQGAWIVDLEKEKLGVAIIIKSDGGTTYLLRDLATFIHRKTQGFTKQLYVVDSRQSHTLAQTFSILKKIGQADESEGIHVDYGFLSFKGAVLSTRKGNMVLAKEVIEQARLKVSKIIEEKNPDLKDKNEVVDAVAKSALKFFDLSHNRHSDIEFDWEAALDFEGKSGPYIQYTYTRLASILRKEKTASKKSKLQNPSDTERRVLFLLSIFDEMVQASLKDYLPNLFADYLYDLSTQINRFYHESPVIAETDPSKKAFRLYLVSQAKETMKQGMELLGIRALEEM